MGKLTGYARVSTRAQDADRQIRDVLAAGVRRGDHYFIDDDTFGPGFQFLPGGRLHPLVLTLFQSALDAPRDSGCAVVCLRSAADGRDERGIPQLPPSSTVLMQRSVSADASLP